MAKNIELAHSFQLSAINKTIIYSCCNNLLNRGQNYSIIFLSSYRNVHQSPSRHLRGRRMRSGRGRIGGLGGGKLGQLGGQMTRAGIHRRRWRRMLVRKIRHRGG